MSVPDRPGSSIGQQPHTPSISTPSAAPHANARAPSISQQKSNFTVPAKKSSAIVIKNAQGEIVNFNKPPASPAPVAQAPSVAPTPSAPTPPSRTGSAVEGTHARSESVSTKTEDERKKAMQEAVKQRIEEQNRLKKLTEETEQKAAIDEEARDAAVQEAKAAETTAAELEKEASQPEEKPAEISEEEPEEKTEPPAQEPAKPETSSESKPAAAEDEIDFDALEAEIAAQEAEEARLEAEYSKKKAADLEAKRKQEEEDAAKYEANMKEMEAKAEATDQARQAELAAEKDKAEKVDDGDEEDKKREFDDLKSGTGFTATPQSTGSPAAPTPLESGTATPMSDVSMPPPARGLTSKRGKATDLTLDTKKPIEPPEPSATLKALQSARKLDNLSQVDYPTDVASPNPALNENAPANRGFKYDKAFLLQFQSIFKEKPSLDWDAKIRDALGDGETPRPGGSARTPSSMGPRQMSNRPQAGAFAGGVMGSFAGPGAARGTTSEQRFQASNAAIRGGAATQNPFAQFGRGSMGPPPAGGRQPSNNALGFPGSPRVGGASRGGSRADSKRNKGGHRENAADNKSMPLTAGMDVGTLQVSQTGWKPRSIGQSNIGPALGGEGLMDPATVQRKVKAALNKMTPEKFDKIADQIMEIAAQSKDETDGRSLRQVIQLTFEKATDEAHWAPMYAMFCRKMLESMSPDIQDEGIKDKNGQIVTGGNLFRKYLLNRCQEEFERGWKTNLPGKPEGQTEEAAMLSDEYYIAAAAKRRGLGLVRFIGELFKLGMLTERIMHECVKKLVDYEGTPDEAEVESLTSLLRTIGKQLDDPASKGQGRMDLYFDRIQKTMDIPGLPSRLKYMLLEIIELRRKGWQSKDDEKGPKTISQIHAEAEEKARQDELKRLTQQSNRGGRGGHMPMGRGDARSFSYNQMPPPDNSNRVGVDDLRRLGNRAGRNTSSQGPTLGPSSMLAGRTNSNRRGLGPSIMGRGDDSGNTSRTGTPPASKEKDKKDESSTNAFRQVVSTLSSFDSH